LEGGGEALSDDPAASPADPQGEAELPRDGEDVPEPGEHRHRARDPIAQPWRVTYVRLLGNLEIEVTDVAAGPGSESVLGAQPVPSRTLALSEVRGFGPLAKAACVALVLNLKNGRTPPQLGEAMDGQPRVLSALPSHLSAVRRTGLVISHKSGIYRIEDLTRDQVDALRFEDLYREIQALRTARDPASDVELIAKAEEAMKLWVDDPLSAHEYFRDELVLKQFADWLTDVQYWYAAALLRRGEPDDVEAAERIVKQIGLRNQAHRGLAELQRLIDGLSSAVRDNGAAERTAPTPAPGPMSVQAAWLERYAECLVELVSLVDLRGFSFEILSSSSLSVFTPLYAKPRTQERPPAGQLTEAGRPPLETVISRTRANLVVGDSGSGKSTFLLHLCARYLDEGSAFIPLFVELGSSPDIPESRLDRQDRLPWQILPELFSSRFADLGVEVSVEDLDNLAKATPVVWLIDGLNEIAPPEIRFALAEAISVCVHRWPRAKFVVTTSETGLHGYGTPPGFQRVDVDEFQPEDVDFFLEAFCRDRYSELRPEQRREKWEPLAISVRESAELRALARSPLLLTAMTLAYLVSGRLPDSRADLLRGAVEWLINKKAPLLRSYVRSRRDVRVIFSELAYQMMARAEVPLSRVGRGWAADCLRPLDCYQGDVSEFLDAAVSAGGLLMQRGPGDLGMHDAFRDYLAASRIAARTDDPDEGWWSELGPHLDDPEWHGVTALVPGALLLLGGSERVDLFIDLLGASCADQDLAIRASRVALGGGILRELRLAGYRPSNASRWIDAVRSMRELLDDPAHVPLDVRYGAAVAYGVMGDERLVRPDATWIAMPAGQFWMGAQADAPGGRNYDVDAAPWESPVILVEMVPFAIRKFPITVQEYIAFIEAGGYERGGSRYWTPDGSRWRAQLDVRAPLDWDIQLSVPNAPVSWVSWHECVAYCNWLTGQGSGEFVCRLPFEREWEYVAKRDISSSQFRWGDRMHGGDDAEANWAGAFLRRKSPVGIFPASTTADGVADMFGNVEEWCLDAWEDNAEHQPDDSASAADRRQAWSAGPRHPGPNGRPESTKRVVRGGSCIRFSRLCRPTYRTRILEDQRYASVGFRPVRVAADGGNLRRPAAAG